MVEMFCIFFCIFGISQVLATLTSPIDIGYKFDANTLYWIGYSGFNLTVLKKQETPFFYTANSLAASEHGGTHLDAPYHFNKDGWKVGDIPLERLLVQGVMLDMKKEASKNPDFELTVQHLEKWEKIYGPLPNPVVILVNFGWASKYSNKTAYFGGTETSNLHFPGISADAAKWMVKTGKVVGIGVDTPSLDPGKDQTFQSHQILSAANIYGIENLALSNATLPARNFQLVIMPMKIAEGSGAPLRIIAYPPQSSLITFLYNKISVWWYSIWG